MFRLATKLNFPTKEPGLGVSASLGYFNIGEQSANFTELKFTCDVVYFHRATSAKEVHIVSDLTGWSKSQGKKLEKGADGIWTYKGPTIFRTNMNYQYIVDGRRVADSFNPNRGDYSIVDDSSSPSGCVATFLREDERCKKQYLMAEITRK